jgi:hypothetical protein
MKKTFITAKSLLITILVTGVGTVLLTGCASSGGGRYDQTSTTDVNLTQGNYKVVKVNATGSSSGFRLLGLIPFSHPSYSEAKTDLYDSLGENLTGRSIALSNQSEDRSSLYLILFSIPKITISADIIEFNDRGKPAVQPIAQPTDAINTATAESAP